MVKLWWYVFLASALFAVAFAAPEKAKEKDTEVAEVEEKSDKKSDERAVVAQDESWNSWLTENAWPITTATLGTIFVLGGLSVAGYYFGYLNYVGNNAQYDQAYSYNPYYQQQPGYYQTGVARSLDTARSWNFARVLELIEIAQKTYSGFDWQSLDCQKKVLCELAHKNNDFGETGRKISGSFSYVTSVSERFVDALEGLPMPQVLQHYLKEYKEAINQGRSSTKDCGMAYSTCKFSLKELFNKPKKA